MTKGVLINAGRLDYDGARLNLTALDAALGEPLTRHDDHTPTTAEITARCEGHTVVISKEVPIDVSSIPDTVKLICEAGTGYNNIDLDAAKARGITVCNVPSYATDAVAHLVITFVLNFSSSVVRQHRSLAKGDTSNFPSFTSFGTLPHFELGGKTIGLVGGTGAIGKKVGEIAKVLGMKVLMWSRSATTCDAWEAAADLNDLLSRSDFVSVHCPLTETTKHLIDADALKRMKPTAYLVNTARGPVINQDDLIAALTDGTIAGAGLDVQDPEPPVAGSPLYTLENVILTPHIGWKREESRQRLMDTVAENIRAFLAGNPVNVVGGGP
jgi:glycerate dehydrogenase